MSAPSAAAGGGSSGGGSAGGDSASGGSDAGSSAGHGSTLPLSLISPFWFHSMVNLPGTNRFIGFCGQRDDFITRLYLLWIEKTPNGDFKGDQHGFGTEIHHVNPRTSNWAFGDKIFGNPEQKPGIHYHDRNFYQGLPIMIVPILSMMEHFILLTDRYIYFFRINPQKKLEVIHTIEASEAERRLYNSCAISENGQIMVVHHNSGFSVFSITMNSEQFQVDMMQYVDLPPQDRNVPGLPFLGDLDKVKMTKKGVVIWYESPRIENKLNKSINVLFPTDPQIFRFSIETIPDLEFGRLTKFFQISEITPTKIWMIVGGDECFRLLILNLDLGNIRIGVGERMYPGFTIQWICPCSVNPTHFFVAGQRKEVMKKGTLFDKYKLTPTILEIKILEEEKALVKIGEQDFDKGGVTECSYLTSSGGNVVASFIGDDYRARVCGIRETTKVESSVQPSLSRSTLNNTPIELQLNCAFALLSDGAILASNVVNGLTLFGPGCNPVASTKSDDAHKSPITSMFSLEVSDKLYFLSFSSVGSFKIWSIQKRGETVRLQIVATVSTADIVQKKGVKFLALDGQTLLIVTNKDELLRFHIEITGGIRADIRPIPGPVVQMESGQICQGIADFNSTHALIHVAISGVPGSSLVLVSLEAGAAEMFESIGIRPDGKSPAVLTQNGFAVSAVVPTTVCSTALAPGGKSCSFTPKYIGKDNEVCDATILAIIPCEGGFIYITANGFLFQFVYNAQQTPVFKKRIAVLECALTPKCRLQVSGNTVMVCQPRDDSSFELRTFQF